MRAAAALLRRIGQEYPHNAHPDHQRWSAEGLEAEANYLEKHPN